MIENFVINTIKTGIVSKAPAKRTQHANATYRNNVGRNMLRAFGHRVATCWVLFDHGQI